MTHTLHAPNMVSPLVGTNTIESRPRTNLHTLSQSTPLDLIHAEGKSEQIQICLLGHTYLCSNGTEINISTKAIAMLTYLALEGVSHHREKLANLLWENSNNLLNLRVELSNLKRKKLDFFSERQAMLHVDLSLDIEKWLAEAPDVKSEQLSRWLSVLRGLPLTGLEDVGSIEFRSWVERQRIHLCERIEEQMGLVYKRFFEEGEKQAARQVKEHAKSIGLEFDVEVKAPIIDKTQSFPGYLDLERSRLLDIMQSSIHEPQLVILKGARGVSRMMIDDLKMPEEWQVIQLQYSPNRDNMHQALFLQAYHLLTPEQQQQMMPSLFHTNIDQDNNAILRFGQVLSMLKTPVLLAVHDMYEAPDWLRQDALFLMELPSPLVLVGSRLMIEQNKSGQSKTQFDWHRLHYLDLPPVTTQQITKKLEQTHPYLSSEERQNTAARIGQCTEGWFPYTQAATNDPNQTERIPESLSRMLCNMRGNLSKELMFAFAQLAQVQSRFTPQMMEELLGEHAQEALQTGLNTDLLVQASNLENLNLHTLMCRTKDHEQQLAFKSELHRIALASSITSAQRQAVRVKLAQMLLNTHTAMSLYYAERAHLPQISQQAHLKLRQMNQNVIDSSLLKARKAQYMTVHEPVLSTSIAHTLATPNGYQVTRSKEYTEIRRRGRLFDLTHLNLNGLKIQPGAWSMVMRLDVAPTKATVNQEVTYPLALRFGAEPWKVFTTVPIPEIEIDDHPAQFMGTLPMRQWIKISGHHYGEAVPLQIGTCAVDLSLTISSIENGGQKII